MLLTTTETVAYHEIQETLGMVRGSVIRAKHIGTDIIAALRNLVGGEVYEYTKLLSEARTQATDRMIRQAKHNGADAVICVRYATSMVMAGSSEILVYGTAVRLKPRTS